MKPGTNTTLYDIAHRTGLSIATVSRALHREDSPNVSEKTRRRVQEVARSVGYQANLLGRSLSTGRSHVVSYWTISAFSTYYASVAKGISDEAANRGFQVILNNTFDPAHSLEAAGAGDARQNRIAHSFDGMILCDVAFPDNEYAAQIRRPNIPTVGIGISYPEDGDYVGIDLTPGTVQLLRHLIAQGCRRIAHMGQPDALAKRDPRAIAYEETLREAGLEREWIPIKDHIRKFARTGIADYLADHRLPDAVFCANDEVAIGCYRGCLDLGIAVPEDVLIAGCDGIEETAYHYCPLTTLAIPVTTMCEKAWEFLLARIQEPGSPPRQMKLLPELVLRRSTDR
ncbi:MAG: LacI family DNA-binding transcriptional regulator [Akkermansiaceae bacterium]|nr:LacI family DNA-binding transcriptional regulator [Armatimonadota bacterium]